MTQPVTLTFVHADETDLAAATGRIVVLAGPDGTIAPRAARLDGLTGGAIARACASDAFAKLKEGEALDLAFPHGLAAEAVQVVRLGIEADRTTARKAGAAIGARLSRQGTLVVAGDHPRAADVAFGLAMRAYDFSVHKTAEPKVPGPVHVAVDDIAVAVALFEPMQAVAEGVFLTRDLVNEPANVLTTTEFAARLEGMRALGLSVEVLDEAALETLGMRTLLAVGQGSASPSRVVVIEWKGGAEGAAPLALVGKGVVFDTGGISIKPAGGMEEMTMDMGGAAVVAGVMHALARRGAKANVVGLVGIVENMPDGMAQRPGDVVRSMKGDTVEVINTDAEGRLVLADVMWYAQERFAPAGMIDLATLTGAIIVALGHENAGVFSNDDGLCDAFLAAAKAEGEGAWRLPMGEAYDAKLKSRVADMMNVGGRDGGAITAAQFLARFVKKGTPWVHLDIAGTALTKGETALAPKGATGWGVMALDRLVADRFEG